MFEGNHHHALDAIPSSPPISGVPMDIMLVIFDILRQSCGSDFKINWVSEVTHVCRSWRETALLASFLWTDIDVEASVSWAVEFARRSRQAPINIVLDTHVVWSPELYECLKTLLRENRPRIREIRLCDVEDGDPIVSTLSDCAETGSVFFPILESLKISIDWYGDYEPSLILTNHILHAPNLKALSLMDCGVEEDFASIHNISCLSITENIASKSTTNFLRKALPQMVNLETLSLQASDEFINIDNDTGFGIQVATLPKLYNIEIHWPIEHIISILQMISYGPRRKMQLTALLADFGQEQSLRLFTCFMSHAGNLPRLRLLYNSSKLRVCDLREDVTPANFCLSIEFPYHTHPQSLVDLAPILLGGLVHRMDHRTLQALSLGVKLSTQSWVKVFGTLPLLARIRIINAGEQEFFAALINEIESGDILPVQQPDHKNATMTLPFQGLRAVRIVGRIESYLEEEMAFILRCLRVRKERGYKLKKLHFTSVAEEDLKRQLGALRRVVGSLEVH